MRCPRRVSAHVHALHAAFAAYYHPGDVEAVKELLGYRSIATTQVYLRKFDKATAMERVRNLSWAMLPPRSTALSPDPRKLRPIEGCGEDAQARS
jgi:hypothetical protein